MAELGSSRVWGMRAAYLGLMLLIVFLGLLPLETRPRTWAPPDLMLAITLVWAMRRPDYVPSLLVAAVFLMTDFLFQRPPGLMAALVLMATEWCKARSVRDWALPFGVEWFQVGIVLLGIFLANRIVLALTFVDQPPLTLTVIQLVMTIVFYPVVVVVSQVLFGVRKVAPGDVDAQGQRL